MRPAPNAASSGSHNSKLASSTRWKFISGVGLNVYSNGLRAGAAAWQCYRVHRSGGSSTVEHVSTQSPCAFDSARKSENICLALETRIEGSGCGAGIIAVADPYPFCFLFMLSPGIGTPGTWSSSSRVCTSVAGTKYRIVVSSDL